MRPLRPVLGLMAGLRLGLQQQKILCAKTLLERAWTQLCCCYCAHLDVGRLILKPHLTRESGNARVTAGATGDLT